MAVRVYRRGVSRVVVEVAVISESGGRCTKKVSKGCKGRRTWRHNALGDGAV